MPQPPTLRQLRYFVALADHGSFLRAAEACSVTQSTLSGGLMDLEAALEEKLVDRTSRKIALTRAGEALLDPAREILARADGLAQIVRQNRAPLSGPLTLGVIPTIAPYVLPVLLPALQRQFPSLQLQLREDITERLVVAMERGQVDAVLMAFPYDLGHAETMPLWEEPFFIAAPAAGAERFAMARVGALGGEDVLLLDDGHCLRDHAVAACRLQPARQKKAFGATSLSTVIQMVRHGYGITLLPAMAVEHGVIPKGVAINRFANPQPSRRIGLAWRKNSPRDKELRLLGDVIVKTAGPR